MITNMISFILGIFLFCSSLNAFCQEQATPGYLELEEASHNSWLVSGLLENEYEEPYGFLFKVERFKQHYHASAAIYDLNKRQILWHEEAVSSNENGLNLPLTEKVGPFFWHYSAINSSLIIGYQDTHRQIFNLKFDLIEPTTLYKSLNPTVDLKIKEFWSGSINGHIYLNQEEFVHSNNAWIQNLSQQNSAYKSHAIHELLCKFQDGESLFALQIPEKSASKAAIASLYNSNGEKQQISQFINLKKPSAQDYLLALHHDKNPWHIHAVFNHQDYDILHAEDTATKNQGYCVYLENPWKFLAEKDTQELLIPKKISLFEKTIALGKKPFKIPLLLKNKMTS